MQNFTTMERRPGKFQVGFSVSCSGGMDVLLKITFLIPSKYNFQVIMINKFSDRNIHDMTLIYTRVCKRIKSQNSNYCQEHSRSFGLAVLKVGHQLFSQPMYKTVVGN